MALEYLHTAQSCVILRVETFHQSLQQSKDNVQPMQPKIKARSSQANNVRQNTNNLTETHNSTFEESVLPTKEVSSAGNTQILAFPPVHRHSTVQWINFLDSKDYALIRPSETSSSISLWV